MDQLTDAERAALSAITAPVDAITGRGWSERRVTVRPAWRPLGGLDEAHAEALVDLIGRELAEVWERPDGPQVTLTPWGAVVAGVLIDEYDGEATEDPQWHGACIDQDWDNLPLVRSFVSRGVRIGRQRCLPLDVDQIEDPHEPEEEELLIDPLSDEPMRLFVGDGKLRPNGVTVTIDPKLKGISRKARKRRRRKSKMGA